MRTAYINTEKIAGLPEEVCVLQVSTLLRELIIGAVEALQKGESCSIG